MAGFSDEDVGISTAQKNLSDADVGLQSNLTDEDLGITPKIIQDYIDSQKQIKISSTTSRTPLPTPGLFGQIGQAFKETGKTALGLNDNQQAEIAKLRGDTPETAAKTTLGMVGQSLAHAAFPTVEELKSGASTSALGFIPDLKINDSDSPTISTGKEAANLLLGVPKFIATPSGVASMATGGIAPKLIASIFTTQALDSLGQQVIQTHKDWNQYTPAQQSKAILDMVGSGEIALGSGGLALKNTVKPLAEPPTFGKALKTPIGAVPPIEEPAPLDMEIGVGEPKTGNLPLSPKLQEQLNAADVSPASDIQQAILDKKIKSPVALQRVFPKLNLSLEQAQEVLNQVNKKNENVPEKYLTTENQTKSSEGLSPQDLKPAIMVEGKPVMGGDTHSEIVKNNPNNPKVLDAFAENNASRVFVDTKGRLYSREEAAKALGEVKPLQSERLNELKQSKPSIPTSSKNPLDMVRSEDFIGKVTEQNIDSLSPEKLSKLNHPDGIRYGIGLSSKDVPRLQEKYNESIKQQVKAFESGDGDAAKQAFGKSNFFGGALMGATRGKHPISGVNYEDFIKENPEFNPAQPNEKSKAASPQEASDLSLRTEHQIKPKGIEAVKSAVAGEKAISTRGEDVLKAAIEKRLIETLPEIPTHVKMDVNSEVGKAVDFVKSNPELALKIAKGEEVQTGIRPEAIYTTLEEKAIREGDVETLKSLSESKVPTEAGQRLKLLDSSDPNNPVKIMRDIRQARESAGESRLRTTKEKMVNEIKTRIRKSASKMQSWEDVVKQLICRN